MGEMTSSHMKQLLTSSSQPTHHTTTPHHAAPHPQSLDNADAPRFDNYVQRPREDVSWFYANQIRCEKEFQEKKAKLREQVRARHLRTPPCLQRRRRGRN